MMGKLWMSTIAAAAIGFVLGFSFTGGSDEINPASPKVENQKATSQSAPSSTATSDSLKKTVAIPQAKSEGAVSASSEVPIPQQQEHVATIRALQEEVKELEGRLLRFEEAEERIAPHVDTPEFRTALAEEYYELVKVDEQVELAMTTVFDSLLADRLPPEGREEAIAVLNERYGWQSMKGDMTKVMTDVFDANDIKDIINFQKSDLGQRLQSKQPEMMTKMMASMQERMADTQAIGKEIEDIINKYNEDDGQSTEQDSEEEGDETQENN